MPHFDALKIYSCRKHFEKRRNCLKEAISPFLTMVSTLYGTYFSFECTLKCRLQFHLDQSEIVSSGNELIRPLSTIIHLKDEGQTMGVVQIRDFNYRLFLWYGNKLC